MPLARFQASRALFLIGKDATAAVPAWSCSNDGKSIIEIEAAKAILQTGKTHEKAVSKLEQTLQTNPAKLALQSIRYLGRAGRPLFPAVKKATLEATTFYAQRDGFNALQNMEAIRKRIVAVWLTLAKGSFILLDVSPQRCDSRLPHRDEGGPTRSAQASAERGRQCPPPRHGDCRPDGAGGHRRFLT